MRKNGAVFLVVGIYLIFFGMTGVIFGGRFALIAGLVFVLPGASLIVLALIPRGHTGSFGSTDYDDYLRQQESRKKDHTYCAGIMLEDNCSYNKSYDASPAVKGMPPACGFLIMFGTIFVFFGLFFITIMLTLIDEPDLIWFFIIVPLIFVITGAIIIVAGARMGIKGQTPQNLTINGISAEEYNRRHGYVENGKEKDEDTDTSDLSTDWKP